MKFREIFRFEFVYQLNRWWTWIVFVALVAVTFLMTRDGTVSEALHDDFFINSPFAIAKTTVVGNLLWLLVVAAIAGEAAARDVSTGMYPLTYTAPISKAQYLGGKFLAAFALNALILFGVQVGILLGVYLPGVDAELIGPFRPAAFIGCYAFIALPNALIATVLQFSVAIRSGQPMTGFMGSFFLFFMSYIFGLFLFFQGQQQLASVLDPIGVHFILSELSHLWTTTEKSYRMITLEGTILTNRMVWTGVALLFMVVTYLTFQFAHRAETAWWQRLIRWRKTTALNPLATSTSVVIPHVRRTFGFRFHFNQILTIAWASFRMIATSWAGLFMLVVVPLLAIPVLIDQMQAFGIPSIPTTIQVIGELTAPLSAEVSRWVIIPLLIIFFAGELVWRERDAGLGEIADTMPGSEWAPLLGKLAGLSLILVAFTTLQMTAGIISQLILDHHHFEIGLYLKILFGLQLPEYVLFGVLVFVIHVLVNQRYVGHLVAIIAYMFIAGAFALEHSLIIYGSSPNWSYTEMRGFGSSIAPWAWFKSYWTAWALLLTVAGSLFWVRGKERGFRFRFQLARSRFTRATALTTSTAVVFILAIGGFIFYNTNVLNKYLTEYELDEQRAQYELHFLRFKDVPQPDLKKTKLRVEIYPDQNKADIQGSYQLVNNNDVAIDSILINTSGEPGLNVLVLAQPLAPGDSMQYDFSVHIGPHGFRESGVSSAITSNGTFFNGQEWMPTIGYQRSRELLETIRRRWHGLSSRPFIPSLYDKSITKGRDPGIDFEAIIGTDEDQVAVAPGALLREWTENRRRYFHYSTDGPIDNAWAFLSAKYTVRVDEWKDAAGRVVPIRVFHHPAHTLPVERIIASVKACLEYYSKEFGPYAYNHITFAEHPGNGVGMHAEASIITFSEGSTLLNPGPENLDLPFSITAHEMAHEWNVPYAFAEGAPVMSESLAWYYGMKLFENAKGPDHLRKLRHFMRQPYPYAPIRRGEPLLRGLDPYMSYRRGPFALFALNEFIGGDSVNVALHRLLEKHKPENADLATTLDLYHELEQVTPDSLKYLLHDLFEVNTFWDLSAEKVTASQTKAGMWEVTLDVRARKVVADTAGVETAMPMNELIPIGVFSSSNTPLYLKMHRIVAGRQTIIITMPGEPAFAGIDPEHLLDVIEEEDDNNIREVIKKKNED